jgi:hypothetical protein
MVDWCRHANTNGPVGWPLSTHSGHSSPHQRMVGSIRKRSLALAQHLTVHRSCDSAELAWNSDGAGHGGPLH